MHTQSSHTRSIALAAYRAASFLSAFLLFLVQPMASKALLPTFGGSFVVWGACMVFFQAALLVGYTYAHGVQKRIGVRRYSRIHLAFLLLPCLAFPFDLATAGHSLRELPLVLGVVIGLLRSVAWPFLALSSSSLILQRWLSQSSLPQRRNPYTLYAWSNLGSILGLLSYPFALEPLFPLQFQEYAWWGAYVMLVALHVVCLPTVQADAPPSDHRGTRVRPGAALRWLALSAAACGMLLAVTNVITFDVASVPFLWVLPLCIYLVCFVLTFKHTLWCPSWSRPLMTWLIIAATLLRIADALRFSIPVWLSVPFHLVLLFAVCLECSAALVRTRPAESSDLTGFYLLLATGGLLGGLVVSWIVPLLSTTLVEYGLAMAAAVAAIAWAGKADRPAGRPWGVLLAGTVIVAALTLIPWIVRMFLPATLAPNAALVLCALPVALALRAQSGRPMALAAALAIATLVMPWSEPLSVGAEQMHRHRNYYGIYKVYVQDGMRYLQHGTTQHGRQYLDGPKHPVPLAYYHPTTPGARVLRSPAIAPAHVGMIGLGAGSFAAYLSAGQILTIYELDADNLPLARTYFDYLDQAEARGVDLRCTFGDGRLSVRRAARDTHDILIVDAFNSGSIPVHLLTVEAIREFAATLTSDGIILMHISNKVLDLAPVLYNVASAAGVNACEQALIAPTTPDADATWWMAMTPSTERLRVLEDDLGWHQRSRPETPGKPWTDQYCNILDAIF